MAMTQFDKERQRQMAINQTQALMKQGIAPPTIPKVVPKPVGPKDMKGVELKEGQTVLRAMISDRTPYLKFCKVTRVEGGKVYLDDSKQALIYPARVLVQA